MRLFIDDIEIPLPTDIKLARTKQVNDIGSLSNRQSNYSQRIKIPKTRTTQLAFDNLGSPGSTSNKPYERLSAKLFDTSGESEIFDGFAVIDKTSNNYDVIVYDGYINFIKAIENQNLTALDLEDLDHLKNVESVLETWSDDTLPYRYIVADYNGKMIYDTDRLNTDFLIPSVNVSWLWNKVFEYVGWEYTGSVFDTTDFTNLWMTYPKAIDVGDVTTTELFTGQWTAIAGWYNTPTDTTLSQSPRVTACVGCPRVNIPEFLGSSFTSNRFFPIGVPTEVNNQTFNCLVSGGYKFEVEGLIDNPTNLDQTDIFLNVILNGSTERTTLLTVNMAEAFSADASVYIEAGSIVLLSLSGGDTISDDRWRETTGEINWTVSSVDGNAVSFGDAFIDYSIRDFINEVLWRFSLTPFKDKYTDSINFLTHSEWLQSTDNYDWSDKFINVKEQKYILSGYAQRNYLRYKYNDKESNYNDGFITIENVNLKDNKDIIKSNIYSPEKEKEELLGSDYNVYKFWNKEIREGSDIEYKELDNRYYFLRSDSSSQTIKVGSEVLGDTDSATQFPREDYTGLKFNEVITNYYLPIYSILNQSKVLKVNMYLNDADIQNLDFRKLVYIKQLGSYYLINKIPNYQKKGVYPVELIEVDYDTTIGNETPITEDSNSLDFSSSNNTNLINTILTVN